MFPPPRNAVDKDLHPWNGTVPARFPNVESETGWCPVTSAVDGRPSGQNGQACFWFSNGCAAGCPKCDGTSRGPITGDNNSQPVTNPPTGIGRNKAGPNGVVCKPEESTGVNPTMCDSNLRTVNVHAECGGPEDWYHCSPWRAPGAAPVLDSCGVASGHFASSGGDGPFGGVCVNTTHAVLGAAGSKVLPTQPSGTRWKAGSVAQVSWTIEANHAGGYQHRLCLASEELTEECFRKTPLAFVGLQGLRWNGGPKRGGTEIFFEGAYAKSGVVPEGSAWAKNPIPLTNGDAGTPGPAGACPFPPPCTNTSMCTGDTDGGDPHRPERMEIVDSLASQPLIMNQNGATSGFEMCFAPSTLLVGAGSQRSQPKHVSNPA